MNNDLKSIIIQAMVFGMIHILGYKEISIVSILMLSYQSYIV